MAKLISKGTVYFLIVLLAANIFGAGYSQAQSVPISVTTSGESNEISYIDNSNSENNIVKILGIDSTAYPKIKVNIFVDKFCAMAGGFAKEDFIVEEDGNEVAIDNFYFTGRAMGQKLDLTVVFDETDTMADEIDAMQSKVDDLTNKIKSSNIDARYSLVTFKTEVLPKIEWTDDAEVFKREVDLLRASGGNYKRPEDSLGGVATALSFGFRPDAQKIIIVITDEPSMQSGDGWSNSPYHKDDVQQDLLDAGVMLVAVSPDFRSGTIPSNIPRSDLPLYADMRDLAQNSGGLWIDIYSADFSIILGQLEEIITGTYVIEYTSPATTTTDSRIVSVSVNAPDCAEGGASSSYIAPASSAVPNEPPIIIDLISDKTSPQDAGAIITWSAVAEDLDGDQVLYKFFLDYEPMTDWTAEKKWTWIAPEEAGFYRIGAHIRDGKHAEPNGMDDHKSARFEMIEENRPPYITALTPDKTSPQEAGSIINWTAEATDPDDDPVLYRFFLDDEPVTDWTADNTWTWAASSGASSYRVEAQVRDGLHAGPNGMDNRESVNFEIIRPNLPPTISSLTADKTSPHEAGSAITWTAEATDADGDYLEYRFYLDEEIVVQDWSTKSTWVWSTSDSDIGSHYVTVAVRDGRHNPNRDDYRSIGFEVTEKEPIILYSQSASVSVAFSPDGCILASGIEDGTVKLWDFCSGDVNVRTLQNPNFEFGLFNTIAFSPDGHTLASGSPDVMLWDITSGSLIRTLDVQYRITECIAFSPTGQILASSSPGRVFLWDFASGKQLQTLIVFPRTTEGTPVVFGIAFSPDGRTLAAAGSDVVKLFDVNSGVEIRTLEGHSAQVCSVAFSPNGRTLASGSYDNTVKLWDISSGTELWTLEGGTSYAMSVAFSPDGHILASGYLDGTVKLWDVSNGREIQTLEGQSSVLSIAYSPDSRILAAGRNDGIILWWVT